MRLFRSWWMVIVIVLIYARSAEFADDKEEDPCARCDPNAKCEGDHCECLEGFEGNGLTCTKIVKQCGTCSPNAKCVNGECHCNAGFAGNGTVCKKGNVTLQNPGSKVDVDNNNDRQTRNKDTQTTDTNSNSNATVTEKLDTASALRNLTEEKLRANLAENEGELEAKLLDKKEKETDGKETDKEKESIRNVQEKDGKQADKEKESVRNVPTSSHSTLSPNELPTKASSASSSKDRNPTLPLPPSKSSSNPTKMGVTMKNKNPEKAGPTLKPSTTPRITKAATKMNTTGKISDDEDAGKKDVPHSDINIMNELHNASSSDDDSLLKAVAKSSGIQVTPTPGSQTSPLPSGLPGSTEVRADEKAPAPSPVKDSNDDLIPGLIEGKDNEKLIEAKEDEKKGGEGEGDAKGLAPLPTNDKGIDAKSMDGKGIEGKGIEAKELEEKITEGKGVVGKGVEGKDIEGKGIGTEDKGIEGKGIEGKGIEGKGIEGKGIEGKGIEGKGIEGKGIEGKGIEGKGIEGKGIEGKGIEAKVDRIPIEGKVPLPTILPPTTITKPPPTTNTKRPHTTITMLPRTPKTTKRRTTPRKWMPSFPTPKMAPFPPISYQLPSIVIHLPTAPTVSTPPAAPEPAFFVNTKGAEVIRKIELLKHKALFSNPHPKDPDAMLFPKKSLERKLTGGSADKHSNTPIHIVTGQ